MYVSLFTVLTLSAIPGAGTAEQHNDTRPPQKQEDRETVSSPQTPPLPSLYLSHVVD